jgi:hypothetical protein
MHAAIDHRRRFGRDVIGVLDHQGQLVAVVAAALRSSMCAWTPLISSRCESDTPARPPMAPAALCPARSFVGPRSVFQRHSGVCMLFYPVICRL